MASRRSWANGSRRTGRRCRPRLPEASLGSGQAHWSYFEPPVSCGESVVGIGIRSCSMFRLPVHTRDISRQLRRKDGSERSVLYSYRFEHERTLTRRTKPRSGVSTFVRLSNPCPYIGRKFNVSEPDYPAQSIIQFSEWVQIVRAVFG